MYEEHLTEQEEVRREKMEQLREKGIDPFGHRFRRTHLTSDIVENYSDKDKEQLAEINDQAIIAGRVMTKRVMGKAGFLHLQD